MLHLSAFICLLTLGPYCVLSYKCYVDHAEICKENLVDYEGLHFPFYGEDDEELEETCKGMNATFDCITDFIDNCYENPECKEECQDQAVELNSLWQNTGVLALYDKLCFPDRPFRKIYLEHYNCLEEAAPKYSKCYNTSLDAREHLETYLEDPQAHLNATCCFFSWYQGCFVNATMDQCGSNATFVVSFALHMLMGDILTQKCNPLPYCSEPPLPPDVTASDGKSGISSAPSSLYFDTNINYNSVYIIILLISTIARVIY